MYCTSDIVKNLKHSLNINKVNSIVWSNYWPILGPRVATGCISPGHRDNIYSPGVAHGVVTVLLVGATVLSLDAVMFVVIPVIVVLETVVGRIIVVSDGWTLVLTYGDSVEYNPAVVVGSIVVVGISWSSRISTDLTIESLKHCTTSALKFPVNNSLNVLTRNTRDALPVMSLSSSMFT